METYIKGFEFTDYIEKDWFSWKTKNLDEVNMLLEMPAFAGNVSKAPIMFDKDDWKFLSQFPPKYWKEALHWRYNDGLRQISKMREEHPDQQVPDMNFVPQFSLPDGDDQIVFEPEKGTPGVYVGLTNLLRKIEKPIKLNSEQKHEKIIGSKYYKPEELGEKGIQDIDPFQDDPNHQQYRGHYKGGLHGYDLTGLAEVPEDYAQTIPDSQINLPPEIANLPDTDKRKKKAIEDARERIQDALHHTFAGFGSVMKPDVARRSLITWLKTQGVGLLGEPEDQIEDPLTGKTYKINKTVGDDIKKIHKDFPTFVGHGAKKVRLLKKEKEAGLTKDQKQAADEGYWIQNKPDGTQKIIRGSKVPLSIPTITKDFNYKIIDSDGKIEKKNEKGIQVPVLNPGSILPKIRLEDDQRRALAERRGYKTPQGLKFSDALSHPDHKKDALWYSQTRYLNDLLDFYDLLSPEQKEFIFKNKRDLLHWAAREVGHSKDPYSSAGNYIAAGFQPNKGQSARAPMSDEAKKHIDQIVKKYIKEFMIEADQAIQKYIKNKEHSGDVPKEVLNALESASNELTTIGAYLNIANIDSPTMGIHDPDLGLDQASNVDPDIARQLRYFQVYNMLTNLGQAAIGSMPTRRQRKYGGFKTVSAQTKVGDDSEIGDLIGSKSGESSAPSQSGVAPTWFSRRQQLARKGGTLISPASITPEMPLSANVSAATKELLNGLDQFFNSKREIVKNSLGDSYASIVDAAKEKVLADMETVVSLYDEAEKELKAKGVPENKIEQEAQKIVSAKFKERLLKNYPDIFGKVGQEDFDKLIDFAHARKGTSTYDQLVDEFLKNLATGNPGLIPEFDEEKNDFVPGRSINIEDFKLWPGKSNEENINNIANSIEKIAKDKALAERYMYRIISNIYKAQGSDINDPHNDYGINSNVIISALKNAGYLQQAKPVMPQPQMAAKPLSGMTSVTLDQLKTGNHSDEELRQIWAQLQQKKKAGQFAPEDYKISNWLFQKLKLWGN